MEIADLVLAASWLALSVLLLAGLKVYAPSRLLHSPVRRSSLSLGVAGGVFLVYFSGQILVEAVILGWHAAGGGLGPATTAATSTATQALTEPAGAISVRWMVEMSIGTAIVGMVLVFFIVQAMRRMTVGGLEGWGLSKRWLAGLGWGALAYVVVMPWLNLLEGAMDYWLRLGGMKLTVHPTIVALQKIAEEARPWDKTVLVLVAGLVAPVVEEMVFRGIIQTALVQRGWGLAPLRGGMPEHETVAPREAQAGGVLEYARQVGVYPTDYRPSAGHRLGAMVLTAALFAGIHFMPTQFPVLFVLGLALGYVYERTGNLWASIVLHALFNSVTLAALMLSKG